MSYSIAFALNLGAPGITDARAQIIDAVGANLGSPISTGFAEVGSNFYQWFGLIPEIVGGVKFYSAATPATILDFKAINLPVWSQSPRTLTQSAAQVVAAVASPSFITVLRGDSLLVPITGLGDLSSYTSIDFTVKYDERDSDAMAVLRIRNNATSTNDGLLRLNGMPALNAADGAITISDLVNGDISISLVADDVAALPVGTWSFDIQVIKASGVVTLTNGLFIVSSDITRAVS
jgi:hypothetical protein